MAEFPGNLRWLTVMTSLGKPSCNWRSWFLCETEHPVELLVSSGYYFDEVLNSFRWWLQPDGKAVVQSDQMKPQLPVRQRASKKQTDSKSCCCYPF